MKKHSVEVILATYNGEKYIKELLDSIYFQTRKPDLLSIYDDLSSDNTVAIIKEYIKEKQIKNWRLYINVVNKGWKLNFMDALDNIECDYVFLCDQDDIWEKNKIKIMVNEMCSHPEISVLVSDYQEFYEKASERIKIRRQLGKSRLSKIPFDIHFIEVRRPGCTMLFRRDIIKNITILKIDEMPHDQAVWLSGIINDGLYYLNKKLIKYRRHDGNASPESGHTRSSRLKELKYNKKVSEKILENKDIYNLSMEKERILKVYIRFESRRIKTISTGSVISAIGLITQISLYPKYISWIGDIVSIFYESKGER